MLLFFRIILVIFFIIFIVVGLVICSELRLMIDDFELSSFRGDLQLKYKGKIGLYFLGKIKLFSFKINNDRTQKVLKNNFVEKKIEKMKAMSKYQKKIQRKMAMELIKQLKKWIRLDSFRLKMLIDTGSVIVTSYLVGIISAIIPNVIRGNIKSANYCSHKGKHRQQEKYMFNVTPLYKNQNYIYLNLNSIISIKVVHIINMFKVIGGRKNERTSDRRLNVNCYGKY